MLDKLINWLISLDPIGGSDLFPQGTGCLIGCQSLAVAIVLIAGGAIAAKLFF